MRDESFEKRYVPGRRMNSFYMDMPQKNKKKGSSVISGDFSGYTYHREKSSGKLIREGLQ